MIEAAGGVVWRPAMDGGPEVVLVHRPRYDDWSLPKGKLDPGEHVLLAAVREVAEETGLVAVPGPYVGEVRYFVAGRPKRVRYWSMRAGAGTFVPGAEVDAVRWLTPKDAVGQLTSALDRDVVGRFAEVHEPTQPLLALCPTVGATGGHQPGVLTTFLQTFGIDRAVDPSVAGEPASSALQHPSPVAVCAPADVLDRVLAPVLGNPLAPGSVRVRPGQLLVLHRAADGRVVAVDRFALAPAG